MKQFLRNTLLAFLILALFFVSGKVIFYAKNQLWEHQEENFFLEDRLEDFIPKGEDIKTAIIGFDNFVADFYWLRVVQFTGANARSLRLVSIYEYLDLITDLDPYFTTAYRHGALLLPMAEASKKAVTLLEKGLEEMPDNWELYWNLAFIKYYYLENYDEAIVLYEKCATLPDCLHGAQKTAANLKAKMGKYEIALQEWIRIYEDENIDEDNRALAKDKIIEASHLIELNKMAKMYTEQIGTNPRSLDDLREAFVNVNLEIFETPFKENPFIWDEEQKRVRTRSW